MRYLVALADESNLTRAAARCHVAQQGLSCTIALLERRLGAQLVQHRALGVSGWVMFLPIRSGHVGLGPQAWMRWCVSEYAGIVRSPHDASV